jgi:hypothetical protein
LVFREACGSVSDDDLKLWAIHRATEIVKREGVQFAVAARERNEKAIEAESALLVTAIALGILEAHNLGKSSKVTEWAVDWTQLTRLEVIDEKGRAFVRWHLEMTPSLQDEGNTLKIFVKSTPIN